MITKEITTIMDFHNAVSDTGKFHALFRGEKSANYKLMPKYGRWVADGGIFTEFIDKDNPSQYEMRVLEEFKRKALAYTSYEPKDYWDWLAIAQHHGLATRLLDWTQSPLVAAFFALTSDSKELKNDAVIYCLDETSIPNAAKLFKDTSPFAIKDDHVFRPKHSDLRISAQQGVFTVHHNPLNEFSPAKLERWLLKNKMIGELRYLLHIYGFTKHSVFPEIGSIAEDVNIIHFGHRGIFG